MRFLASIGHAAAWLTTLTLCGGVFAASLAAMTSVIEKASARAPSETRHSVSPGTPEVLQAEAFDVRKVKAFLSGPDGEDDPSPATAAGLETVRSLASTATPAAVPAPDVTFAATDHVGASAVNLRAGPSKASARLATLAPGEGLRVVGRNGSWVQVVTASGATGWVSARYLGSIAQTEVLTAINATVLEEREPRVTASMAYFDESEPEAGAPQFFTIVEPRSRPGAGIATSETASSSSESSSGEARDPAPGGER